MRINLEPLKLAKSQTKFHGAIDTIELPRLATVVENEQHSNLDYTLDFHYDDHGWCVISGELSCNLTLKCYRCLHPCQYHLHTNFVLAVLNPQQDPKEIPLEYEPVILNPDQSLDLISLLEEEVLLSVPLVPKHNVGASDCQVLDIVVMEEEVKAVNNPFAGLKDITL